MPGWQRKLEPLRKQGRLEIVGIVQEQHAARARLYAQWRRIEWPILVDSLNLLEHRVVPILQLVDETGRISKAKFDDFIVAPPALLREREFAGLEPGEAAFLRGDMDKAVEEFGRNDDAAQRFRLGVALRARAESAARRPGDAQRAVDAWQQALAGNPNQYIWRRRLQQYGPRLAKPYNFYGWVEKARREIAERGEEPHPLPAEPRGAELIDRGVLPAAAQADPDPEGRIERDAGDYIGVEAVVVPSRVRPGGRVRVRLVFRPGKADWNDEGQALTVTLKGTGFRVVEGSLTHPRSGAGARTLECEVEIAADAKAGRMKLPGYALYDVCVNADGTCVYRRRDLTVAVTVDPNAVQLR